MHRLILVAALIGLDVAAATAALAQSRLRSDGTSVGRRQVERTYGRQLDAERRLGLDASGQSLPLQTAPARSGTVDRSGGYRAGSGTVTVPNR